MKKLFSPQTLEDIIEFLSMNVYVTVVDKNSSNGLKKVFSIKNSNDICFISDVGYKVMNGKNLSEKQAQISCKIIKKYLDFILSLNVDKDSVIKLLESPKYRKPLYKSLTIPREIRYLYDSIFAVRFSFNPMVKSDLLTSVSKKCIWDNVNKFWIVLVHKKDYESFLSFIIKHNFKMDESTQKILNYITSLKNGFDISQKENKIFINLVDNDLLEKLLVFYWQEEYETV